MGFGDASIGQHSWTIGEKQTRGDTETPLVRIYDLNGRTLAQGPSKGIYIKNGKKIVK